MNVKITRHPRNLEENPKALSPPVIEEPLYQCAVSVTVVAYEPNATIDVDVDGTVTSAPGHFPFPNGVTIALPVPLVAGQKVKARQKVGGVTSAWTATITVGDHTKDYPAGPPRPQINPGRRSTIAASAPVWAICCRAVTSGSLLMALPSAT